jgi:hypothetical protein
MNFDLKMTVEILERTPKVMKSLLTGLSQNWYDGNEGPSTWCASDVVVHLIQAEEDAWIPRAKIILSEDAVKNFKPFNRSVPSEVRKDKRPEDLLYQFEKLREQNLAELQKMNITSEKLNWKGIHPEFGEVSLKELLATWTVHDLNHVAQMSRVIAKQYSDEVGPWKKFLPLLTR